LTRAIGRARDPLLSLGAALAGFVLAIAFEREFVRLLHLDLRRLEWISDLVLASALGVATFLWLHLRAARSELSRLERAQLVLDTELRIAAEIQRRLLPPLPSARCGFRFAAQLESAGRVGGDFYDFVDRGGSLLMLLADVSGKGVPAAVVMGSCSALFRQLARETAEPAELVTRWNQALLDEYKSQFYLTCFLARIDFATRTLSWVNAGHPAALVVAGAAHEALASTGPPAGLLADARYEERTRQLAGGEALLLVTDGVTEASEGDGRVEDWLAGLVARRRSDGAQAICEQVMQKTRPTRSANGQDDRTVVVVSVEAA
jgi:serine phosphatase RsbU (regulator of sigma subunit)